MRISQKIALGLLVGFVVLAILISPGGTVSGGRSSELVSGYLDGDMSASASPLAPAILSRISPAAEKGALVMREASLGDLLSGTGEAIVCAAYADASVLAIPVRSNGAGGIAAETSARAKNVRAHAEEAGLCSAVFRDLEMGAPTP